MKSGSGKVALRHCYSRHDDKLIIQYFLDTKDVGFLGGNNVWKRMEKIKKYNPNGCSFHSLRERWRKVISKSLDLYKLKDEQKDLLLGKDKGYSARLSRGISSVSALDVTSEEDEDNITNESQLVIDTTQSSPRRSSRRVQVPPSDNTPKRLAKNLSTSVIASNINSEISGFEQTSSRTPQPNELESSTLEHGIVINMNLKLKFPEATAGSSDSALRSFLELIRATLVQHQSWAPHSQCIGLHEFLFMCKLLKERISRAHQAKIQSKNNALTLIDQQIANMFDMPLCTKKNRFRNSTCRGIHRHFLEDSELNVLLRNLTSLYEARELVKHIE